MNWTFNFAELIALLPLLILFFVSLIPLTAKVLSHNKESWSFGFLVPLIGVLVALSTLMIPLFTSWSYLKERAAGTTKSFLIFSQSLSIDAFGVFSAVMILILAFSTLYLYQKNKMTLQEYFSEKAFLILNASLGMILVTWANDLILGFVGLELMSLCFYLLIPLNKEKRISKISGFKYFILGSVASAILLYGLSFIYGTLQTTKLHEMWPLLSQTTEHSSLLVLGVAFFLLGFAFKVAMFPFQWWSPDVYQGSAIPLVGFMAAGVKVALFTLLARFVASGVLASDDFTNLFLALQWIVVLTLIVSNVSALFEKGLKRLLAFSSISHTGFLFLGLMVVALAQDKSEGLVAMVFYLLSYTIMSIGTFAFLGMIENKKGDPELSSLQGLSATRPYLSFSVAVLFLSFAGLPITMGFWSKVFVLLASAKAGLYWLLFWGVLTSVVGVYYYLRPVVSLYMKDPVEKTTVHESTQSFVLLSALSLLILGVAHKPIYQFIERTIFESF